MAHHVNHRAENSGERNGNAGHPDSVVRRARLLHSRGYDSREIRQHLRDEGHEVSRMELYNWLTGMTRGTA